MKLKKLSGIITGCFALICAAYSTSYTQEKSLPRDEGKPTMGTKLVKKTVKGEVVSSNPMDSIVIIKSKLTSDTLLVTQKTELVYNGQKIRFYRIQNRCIVSVKYQMKNGIKEAIQIKLLQLPPPRKTKGKAKP